MCVFSVWTDQNNNKMRQLKVSKKKQELRAENEKIKEQVKKIVLPTLAGVALLIVIFVIYVSRM